MSDALVMKVKECIDELPVYSPCIVLTHSSLRLTLQVAVSTASWHILQNQHYLILCFDGLVKLGNIRMRQSLHQSYFSPDWLLPLNVLYFLFFINFKSNFLVEFAVHANMDNSVGTLSDLVANYVVTHAVLVRENNFFWVLLAAWSNSLLFHSLVLVVSLLLLHLLLLLMVLLACCTTAYWCNHCLPLFWCPNMSILLVSKSTAGTYLIVFRTNTIVGLARCCNDSITSTRSSSLWR